MENQPPATPQTPGTPPPPHPGATQPLPGYMPGQVPLPPGYAPQQGYPQGYPPPQGYPQQPGYPPQQGYPQGYPPPQGYPQQPGYPPMGYPPGYPMPPQQGYPQGYPMPYPGQAYPSGPMTMPQGYAMPPHPSMTSPLPMPVEAPPPPNVGEAVPVQAVPAPAPVAANVPPPVAVAKPAPSVLPAPVAAAAVAVASEVPSEESGQVYHPEAVHDFGPAPKRNAFVEMWKKVGGGSLTLSIAVHAGLLIIAGLIVMTTTQTIKNTDFLPGGGTAQGAQASQDMQHKVQQKRRSTIAKTTPMKKVVSTSTNSSISLPDAPPDLLDVPDVSSMMGGGSLGSGGFGKGGGGGGFGNGMGMGASSGFVSLPPTMRARCSTAERLEKLRKNGGSSECEAAVSKSLEWFKTKQNKDGSWGTNNKAAMTGLVLLCYLGRCETPESPFYGENVTKGIMYLIELSKKNESGMIAENVLENGATYEHGIATYALGEMYTLARLGSKALPGMKDAFENGVKLIIEYQHENGSWTYGGDRNGGKVAYVRDSKGDDLSVTGWQYQALKAAKNTGLKIPKLHESISKVLKYLESKQTKDGGIGNNNRDAGYNQWNLTGTGVLGLQTIGKGKTKVIDGGIKFLHNFLSAEPLDWNKNLNLYAWYYYTQAFFQKGGDEWKFYNEMLLPQILNNQNPDGSWKKGRGTTPGGDLYGNTLCTLQLEVYYRYLKVADREEDSFFDK